jgi:hypothetical protein
MVLYASTGKMHEDEGNTISRDEYANGSTLIGFDTVHVQCHKIDLVVLKIERDFRNSPI